MTFAPVDLAIVAAYSVAVVAVGFLSARPRSDSAEYLLAGRSLTLPVFVMTLVSTWYGGILGVGEFSYLYGISNWVIQGVPYYVFSILFALFLAPRIRSGEFVTIPDRLRDHYGAPAGIAGALLTFLLTTPAPYVLMLGLILQVITGWGLLACLLLGTALATAYLATGGLRSDVNTDVLEFVVMFAGFAVILPFAYARFGGLEFLRANLPPLHLRWDGGHSMQFIAVWFFIALWTFVDPSFYQRCAAARSPRVARTGILVSILFWLLFDAMTATAGLYARAALKTLDQPVMAYPRLAELALPPVAKGAFFAGLLATVMSTLNSVTFISATSLGRDIVWRLRGSSGPEGERRFTRWGLAATGALSVLLALAIPSVVKLWYVIGTTVVPALLIPLVSTYLKRPARSAGVALACMVAGWGTSTAWLVAGWTQELGASERYPLGVEPMYPGLAVALAVWLLGGGTSAGSPPPPRAMPGESRRA